MLLSIIAFIVATLRYAQTAPAGDYGRFVFPALRNSRRARSRMVGACEGVGDSRSRRLGRGHHHGRRFLARFSLWALLGFLRPAYNLASLPPLPAAEVRVQPGMRLGDVAILRAINVSDPILRPGQDATVEVEWLPLRRTQQPLVFIARFRGPENISLGERHSYPGLGRTATTTWTPGRPFVDRYPVPVEASVAAEVMPAEVWLRRSGSTIRQRTSHCLSPIGLVAGRSTRPCWSSSGCLRLGSARSQCRLPRSRRSATTCCPGPGSPPGPGGGRKRAPIEIEWTALGPMACDTKL